MNIQDFLTYLFNALAFGYAALLLLDLGNCLSGKLLDIICSSSAPAATKSALRASAKPTRTQQPPAIELSKREAESKRLAFKTPTVLDPWAAVEIPTHPCCDTTFLRTAPENLSLTAIATPPQLLLAPALDVSNSRFGVVTLAVSKPNYYSPPGLEVANQPELDLAAMPNTELRKRCQSAGIKWRNAHGKNLHLSKLEMLTALSDRTTYCPR